MPRRGKGIVFCSNGDNASVPFNCALTKEIMRMEGWTGIARRQSQFLFKSELFCSETSERNSSALGDGLIVVKWVFYHRILILANIYMMSARSCTQTQQRKSSNASPDDHNPPGIDFNPPAAPSKTADPAVPQEEIVNRGIKDLLFALFERDFPELNEEKLRLSAPTHPFAALDVAANFALPQNFRCSNEGFARSANLVNPQIPVFDLHAFGRQGKIMDSWETVRHCYDPCEGGKGRSYGESSDWCEMEIGGEALLSRPTTTVPLPAEGAGGAPAKSAARSSSSRSSCGLGGCFSRGGRGESSSPGFSVVDLLFDLVNVSTVYHDGNHAEYTALEIWAPTSSFGKKGVVETWQTLIGKTKLEGHSSHWYKLGHDEKQLIGKALGLPEKWISMDEKTLNALGRAVVGAAGQDQTSLKLRLHSYPDGGIARLRLFRTSLLLPAVAKELAQRDLGGRSLFSTRDDVESVDLQDLLKFLRSLVKGDEDAAGVNGPVSAELASAAVLVKRFGFEIGNQQKVFGAREDVAAEEEEDPLPPGTSRIGRVSAAQRELDEKKTRNGRKTLKLFLDLARSAPCRMSEFRVAPHFRVNFASEQFGAKILYASNQHYGPATRLLSDTPPMGMHDGFETKRARPRPTSADEFEDEAFEEVYEMSYVHCSSHQQVISQILPPCHRDERKTSRISIVLHCEMGEKCTVCFIPHGVSLCCTA